MLSVLVSFLSSTTSVSDGLQARGSSRLNYFMALLEDQSFLGASSRQLSFSGDTAQAIDQEINKIIEDCYQEAMILLEGKIGYLHKLSEVLLESETIDAEEVNIILKCREISKINEALLQKRQQQNQAV